MGATIVVLVVGMLVTGCLNTLLLKYQDQRCEAPPHGHSVSGCASFPVLQSLMMFTGESLCFAVVGIMQFRAWLKRHHSKQIDPLLARPASGSEYVSVPSEDDDEEGTLEDEMLTLTMRKSLSKPELRGVATLYLALPALCDICGTTTMSVGLLLVPASIFQMCRGSLVLFVGLFSVIFLGRRLLLHQWISLVLVTTGVFLVGLSNILHTNQPHTVDSDAKDGLLGILLITGAQLFSASQFVIEEWILSRYSIEPLKVAGFEGIFGTILSIAGIAITYFSYGAGTNGTFDTYSGLLTILHDATIWSAFLLFSISIASFNFFGLSVTQKVSATSRSTIDTCRTLFIWLISMVLGWEGFKVLQLAGFVVLVYATLLFNGVIPPPSILVSSGTQQVESGLEHTLE